MYCVAPATETRICEECGCEIYDVIYYKSTKFCKNRPCYAGRKAKQSAKAFQRSREKARQEKSEEAKKCPRLMGGQGPVPV